MMVLVSTTTIKATLTSGGIVMPVHEIPKISFGSSSNDIPTVKRIIESPLFSK